MSKTTVIIVTVIVALVGLVLILSSAGLTGFVIFGDANSSSYKVSSELGYGSGSGNSSSYEVSFTLSAQPTGENTSTSYKGMLGHQQAAPYYYCGDGNCDYAENCDNCEADCGCSKGYECKSNVCIDNKCISQSLIRRILNWLKSLFGG